MFGMAIDGHFQVSLTAHLIKYRYMLNEFGMDKSQLPVTVTSIGFLCHG